MTSQINPTKPLDGVPAVKSELRANLQAARSEIEALQDGKADLALEISLSGTHTVDEVDLGNLLTYSGSGHTWTVKNPARPGEVAIENDGSGAITLNPSGVSIVNGVTQIAAGKSASLRFFSGGAKVKVFAEG